MRTEVELPKGISIEELSTQVNVEFSESRDFVQSKRDYFNAALKLYNAPAEDREINANLIFSMMDTMLSLYFDDEINIKFTGRNIGDGDIARNLQNLAKFDYEEMKLAEKKYQVQRDRLFFGAGIEVSDGWSSIKEYPKTRVVNPMSWYCDPAYDVDSGFRYHGFDLSFGKWDFKPGAGYFNIDDVKDNRDMELQKVIEAEMSTGITFEQAENTDAVREARKLYQTRMDGYGVYSVYRYYLTSNEDGKKYLTEWGNDRSLLIRIIEITPVREEEKEDKFNIDFPVVIRNWRPLRGDPFGVSMVDLLQDKQKAMELFHTLNRIKAEYSAYGDIMLYDPKVVDVDALKNPTPGVKAIKTNGLSANPNPIKYVDRPQVSNDAVNEPQILQNQAQFDIGLNNQSLGIQGDRSVTAREQQSTQANANLKIALGSKLDMIAEKKFWDILWYRMYQKHFKWNSIKQVSLNNGFGEVAITVKKKDINTKNDIDVKIESKNELDKKNMQSNAGFLTIAGTLMENAKSEYSKNAVLRKMCTAVKLTEEESFVFVDETPDEMQAKLDLELLNRDEDVGPIKSMDEDHMTYINIYNNAIDTDAKFRAISKRKLAYEQSGQQAQQQQADKEAKGVGAATQNQLTSNMLSQANTTNVESLSANG